MMPGSGGPTATIGGAPSKTCTAGVVRLAPPTPNAPPIMPATNPERTPSRTSLTTTSGGRVQRLDRAADHVALARVARFLRSLRQGEPPDLLHLVIVQRGVASHRPHEEEGHLLVHSLSVPHEPIGDVAERTDDLGVEARLLLHLSEGRLFGLLAGFNDPFGEPPSQVALSCAPSGQGHLGALRTVLHDYPARREFRTGLHRHGRYPLPPTAMRATLARVARTRSLPRILRTARASPP